MKKKRLLIAVFLTVALVFCMTGCGSFNASALVKATLDLYKDGKVTEEITSVIDMEKDDIQATYDKEFKSLVKTLVTSMNATSYTNNGGQKQIEDLVKAMLGSCKYDVSEEATKNDDDSYTVVVTAYKPDTFTKGKTYINEVTKKWTKKIENGTYHYTTNNKLMQDYYSDLIPGITKLAKNPSYDKGTKIEVTVSKNKDDKWVVKSNDLNKVLKVCTGV